MPTIAERHAAVDADLERLLAIEMDKRAKAVMRAWADPPTPLFAYVTPSGMSSFTSGRKCGCLTQVWGSYYVAWTPELTEAIRNDERIQGLPGSDEDTLRVFAEWQHRIIDELNPPPAATVGSTDET